MNNDTMFRDRFALFIDFYNAPKNKRLIYYIALSAWTILFLLIMTILPLTASSNYRVAFYLPLAIFMILEALSTHWLIQCALEDYRHSGTGAAAITEEEGGDTFVIHQ